MPANLTPQYQRAELEYRRAQTAVERLPILERMLALIPKHKGTEKLQAELKARLSATRDAIAAERRGPRSVESVYRIPRQGAATVVLIGGPNSGKSSVLASLTPAPTLIAPYPFTTREPIPGLMTWNGFVVQVIDTPPIAAVGPKPALLNLIRSADLVLLTMDGSRDEAVAETAAVIDTLAQRHTRLMMAAGYDPDEPASLHLLTRLVITRGHYSGAAARCEQFMQGSPLHVPVWMGDCASESDRDRLRHEIIAALELVRIYTRPPGSRLGPTIEAEEEPLVLRRPALVADLAAKIHADLADRVRSAKVWSAALPEGRVVGRDYELADRDVVELRC